MYLIIIFLLLIKLSYDDCTFPDETWSVSIKEPIRTAQQTLPAFFI